MGASTFTDVASGVSAKDAYKKAVDQALWEYGHDSYNGTISTTHGFVDVSSYFPKGMHENTKIDLAERSLSYGTDFCKWDEKLNKLVHVTDDEQLQGLTSTHRQIVKSIARLGIEKWGPCGCLKLQDGKYYFFGWAAE